MSPEIYIDKECFWFLPLLDSSIESWNPCVLFMYIIYLFRFLASLSSHMGSQGELQSYKYICIKTSSSEKSIKLHHRNKIWQKQLDKKTLIKSLLKYKCYQFPLPKTKVVLGRPQQGEHSTEGGWGVTKKPGFLVATSGAHSKVHA